MSVTEGLDELRAGLPGCDLAAFIDLEAGMVLAVSAQSKQRQEVLGALGESACQNLPMAENNLARCLSLNASSAPADVAVVLSSTGTVAFVRSPVEANEALCCSCSPNVAVDAIIDKARAALSDMAESD